MGTVPAASVQRHRTTVGALTLMLSLTCLAACSGDEPTRPDDERNVILLIGDGLGDSEITVARNTCTVPTAPLLESTPCRTPVR